MRKKSIGYLAIAGIAVMGLIGVSASVALAADSPGSTGKYFLVKSADGTAVSAGSTNPWAADVSGSPEASNTSYDKVFTGPSNSTAVRTFISPRGSEANRSQWNASALSGFQNATTKTVLLPNANLSGQDTIEGNSTSAGAAAVKAAGGNYSVGLAFFNGNSIVATYFTYITVTQGTGAWTFETPDGPVAPPSGSFSSDLNVPVAAAADGVLNLVRPSATVVNFLSAGLVSGLSNSTGTLGQFSVVDERVVSKPGWKLRTTVGDFTDGSNHTISKAQLGLEPVLVSSTATGVTLGTTQVAGSGTYPSTFATAPVNSGVGTTVFNANMRFIAPAASTPGTYHSTLTIDLIAPHPRDFAACSLRPCSACRLLWATFLWMNQL